VNYKLQSIGILILIFAISIIIRKNQITSQIDCEEQTYILTLQTVEIWRNQGIVQSNFAPNWTYANEGDAFFPYYKRLENKKGQNFYTSFPPLSFWTSYIVLMPFDIKHGKLVLQILNLILHFVSAVLIYLIICFLFHRKPFPLFIQGLVGFTAYTFMPVLMYLHTDIFFPEMLGQCLWIAALFVSFKILNIKWFYNNEDAHTLNNNKKKGFKLLFFFALIMLFIYTEWIAVFFVIGLSFILLKKRKDIYYKNLLISLLGLSALSLGLLLLQYSSINGFKSLIEAMGIRYLERSGFFGETYSSMGVHLFSIESLFVFFKNMHKALKGFGYFVLIICVLIPISRKMWHPNNRFFFQTLFALSILPILLHFIVFFNANALHFLLMARLGVPIAIFFGIVSTVFIVTPLRRVIFYPLFLTVCVFSGFFYKTHLTKSINNTHLDKLAQIISTNTKTDEAVIIITLSECSCPEKYLTYASKRNVIRANNIREVKEIMKRHNKPKAAVYIEEKHNETIIIEKQQIDLHERDTRVRSQKTWRH